MYLQNWWKVFNYKSAIPAYKVSFAYPEQKIFPKKAEMFYDVEGFSNSKIFLSLYKKIEVKVLTEPLFYKISIHLVSSSGFDGRI
jgi:hypothetical protein